MKRKTRKNFYTAIFVLATFILWTIAIKFIDVSSIGPNASSVGFASFNSVFHNFTGVHMTLYTITDWLSIVPICFVIAFGILGFIQLINRKNILKVDYDILVLGGFYVTVMAMYVLFEMIVVNYRPVLIEGVLEASYPSSTTMLVMCIMPTTIMQLNRRIKSIRLKGMVSFILSLFTAFMVVGRLISGVHWLSDIIGGALLSIGLVMMYKAFVGLKTE